MSSSKAQLLASECLTREGPVPGTLPGALKEMPTFSISRDAFLLRLPSGLKFHYEQGKGVTVSRPADMADHEVALFLNGSVYGAVAWINGLVPLHASAVAHEGRVHAFSGHSGAGKSTLAAALGGHGLPLFADDVLVLDLSEPSGIICLPGHKKLKLWGDAIALTGAAAGQQVRAGLDKFYTEPQGGVSAEPLPLSSLYFLEENSADEMAVKPVSGIERFTMAQNGFYRPHFYSAIFGNKELFKICARFASCVQINRFSRPRRKELFGEGVAMIAGIIRQAK